MGNTTSRSNSQTDPEKTSLLSKEENGITYRIPALIYINDTQTFLAFAEKRTSPSDTDATLLVMRRGTRQNGLIQWSDVQELDTACLPGHRTMNPCPVYDKKFKALFLFFICVEGKTSENEQICTGKNKAQLCYVTSNDSGQNWSKVEDLTERVIKDEIKDCATFAVGPGHGIQMKSGRLIIPAYLYCCGCPCFNCCCNLASSFRCSQSSHAFAFYSDDLGKTWNFGERISTESLECLMAEIIDKNGESQLYCNARSRSGKRVEALSKNSGKNFDPPPFSQKLVECGNGCQGSVLSISTSDTENWLLYSHPTDKGQRKDLGIYLNKSPLSDLGWNEPWIIHHGPSGYSDLTQCEEPDKFACLMECGKKSELEQIAFVEFSLSDIMNNQ
ncbi:sialidase-3-like [Hemibagrus wyckioides]|uniref:sialidase-3-like n=1 Tax=Hemibagrus wyckioides TaxID=337641 RepID=UPI00266D8764|nr:sialidase-3-like [Hemibagrus wyckioides]XP_058271725.1 sialidase-3-like [Hemibagrus wyckioides]XP_058271726.1 sialidase-3-like [Hemibagrus wyckioides]